MPRLPGLWHPLAEKEAEDALDWYAQRSTKAAGRFTDSLAATVDLLLINPTLFAQRDYGMRVALVPGFPYKVIYRESAGALQVLAIAHAKRRPGYWRKRVSG